jgi:hypothetical protein
MAGSELSSKISKNQPKKKVKPSKISEKNKLKQKETSRHEPLLISICHEVDLQSFHSSAACMVHGSRYSENG